MLLSTQTDALGVRFGDETAVRMLAQAGFDAIDYSCFQMVHDSHIMNGANYTAQARQLLRIAQDHGVVFNQSHAPFSFRINKPDDLRRMNDRVLRSMEVSAILGVPRIVVHPLHYWNYAGNEEMIFEKNVEYYLGLIDACKQFNIQVCAENMWQRDPKRGNLIVDDIASRCAQFAKLLDTVNSPWITGCLDIGHCGLVSEDPIYAIRTLGKTRISALHVHDNDYLSDDHQIPYSRKQDWAGITRALGEIDYQGDFTFEADQFLYAYPDEFLPTAVRFLHDTGRLLVKYVENARPAHE